MKVPIEWLKDFIEINQSPQELADGISLHSLQVEKINDGILEIEITPNRADCLSILGIAREIAAFTNSKLKTQKLKLQLKTQRINKPIEVKIEEPKICPRYSYRIIDGIKIKPSPRWMQERLIAYGFRPINNVVDTTNYIMIEFGQPLHAFDYDKISGAKMTIRRARTNEKLETLDGIIRVLNSQAIIIQDKDKLIDLAGIMGGQNSQVTENTSTIILQAAVFDPILIRKTCKKLSLQTDASYRYERNIDFNGTIDCLNATADLILETSAGQTGKIFDLQNIKWRPVRIIWQPENDVKRILGIKISHEKILNFLKKLEIKCISCSVDKKTCLMEIPSFRHDLKIREDLVEEIARMHNYNNFPISLLSQETPPINFSWDNLEFLMDLLVNYGFMQVINYPYLSKNDLLNANINPTKCLEIANPISSETRYLRPNLQVSILKNIAKNPFSSEINIFESGSIFPAGKEVTSLILATTQKEEIFKQIIEKLQQIFKVNIDVKIEKINNQLLNNFKIRKRNVYTIMIEDIDRRLSNVKNISQYKLNFSPTKYIPISKFPPAAFDLAFITDKNQNSMEIEDEIKKYDSNIFIVELFDEYYFVKKNTKNIAFHIWIQKADNSFNEKEITQIKDKIIRNIISKFKAKLRNY
ncbi:MAG: phenylalanine--tRNA ligase subunit beta [Candidatus Nealsonbacteria bacterium CG23_combo_of_CG06-09_8_20_14_all_40_13]|uniref:Phenylalanine--tRNA ligase beta subunit n=1 Tax=Candidatus Nealsonbacteria bacterium CG23_combo_of_CG06-09_8_20_14_all_40_13 TaxID=1974724 RepID=A0A2G9YSG1_9BACT|nr:MAG: phenylalanine--tRNA ligase subunit beta [Candidatus Nealsonbacteria bacterium CG23_combo_of_CG06-09_8_20_14_all_40_13]